MIFWTTVLSLLATQRGAARLVVEMADEASIVETSKPLAQRRQTETDFQQPKSSITLWSRRFPR